MALPEPNNDVPVSQPPTDIISSISFSPGMNWLAAGSWNNEVRVWELQRDGKTIPKALMKHEGPVLCCHYGDPETVFSGSCDKTAKAWNIRTNQSKVIGKHDAPIKTIAYIKELKVVLTGSWDKTLRYWDMRQEKPVAVVQTPERVYCMDATYPLLTVGCAERHVCIYDLNKPSQLFRTIQSPLKFQSRCIGNFVDKSGFAVGSIEGRVAIQYVDDKFAKKNFAFKCHRHNDEVYAVNSISFHPLGTFATCGSDGVYTFWDKESKQRLKLFSRNNNSITSSCFNHDGTIFAYSLSYDWSKGAQYYDKNKPNQIMLHPVDIEKEVRPRPKEGS